MYKDLDMKALILFALLCVCQGTVLLNYNPNYPLLYSGDSSQRYNNQNAAGGYQFGYNENHASGGSFRKETGDPQGNKYGSYGLRDADGRYRVVNYVADSGGFRANVKSNEPGVAPTDPASTTVNKPLLYAPTLYYPTSAKFPLWYRPSYAPPPSISYGNYKGSPHTTSYTRYYQPSSPKGTPYKKYGYYIYP